jgi:glycosyltransferase involved in cell wall biosynthesis
VTSSPTAERPRRLRIAFLVMNATALGGTVRTVVDLANAFVHRHDVEIISVFDSRTEPFFRPLPDVRVRILDPRAGVDPDDRPDAGGRSRFILKTESKYDEFSARTDQLMAEALQALDADVLVSTRGSLTIAAARLQPNVPVVAQEHVPLSGSVRFRLAMRAHYPRLAAVVAVTQANAGAIRRWLGRSAPPVLTIPNGLPDVVAPISDQTAPIVVAAGRLTEVKQYDRLIECFATVARERPDWTLRIYGTGPERAALREQVQALDLYNSVFLMGATTAPEREVAKASLAVVSSRAEGFGMTILEAMRAGVPVVSVDCPDGPREIITSGTDGVLVPADDFDALGRSIIELIDDHDTRTQMAIAARHTAAGYDMARVATRWEKLLEDVVAGDAGTATG